MEQETLVVKRPIDINTGYGLTLRDVIADYDLAAVADCLAKLCEQYAKAHEEIAITKHKQFTKQWAFAQHEFERTTQRLLAYGPGSGCK